MFADMLNTDLVNIDKHRDLQTGKVTASSIQGGSVQGKVVLLFDDAILSGGTVLEAGKLLQAQGAKEVHFLATHPVFTPESIENITHESITSVVVTNTIVHENLPKKITVLDAAPLFAEALSPWINH